MTVMMIKLFYQKYSIKCTIYSKSMLEFFDIK